MKDSLKYQYVTGKNYDLGQGEIGRIISLTLLNKLIPLGNFGGCGRLKGLFILLLSHWSGRFVFPCIIPFEHQLHRLYLRLKAK